MTLEIAEEGEEFTIADISKWATLVPARGHVIEADLMHSSMQAEPETWAGFLVMDSALDSGGGISMRVKSLGCSTGSLSKELSKTFNRKVNYLHLCAADPCTEAPEVAIHALRVRLFSLEGFHSKMSAATARQAHKWLEDGGDKKGNGEEEEEEKENEETEKEKKEKAKEKKRGKERENAEHGKKTLDPKKVEELRKQLQSVREKFTGRGDPGDPGGNKSTSSSSSSNSSSSSSTTERSGSAQEEPKRLGTGTTVRRAKEKKNTREDTRGTTTRSFADQLMAQARLNQEGKAQLALGDQDQQGNGKDENEANQVRSRTKEQEQKKEKKKSGNPGGGPPSSSSSSGKSKRKGKKSPGKKGGRKKSKKEKKKKKRKKLKKELKKLKKAKKAKKKKKKAGATRSCRTSSKSTSSSRSSDSDAEMDAPLRKKARKKPGSVMALLLDHVRTQLEQGAQLEMPTGSKENLVDGIKVATYLNLHVKPAFPTYNRELRELHVLSTCLDALRRGNLPRVGDILSGRFLALHQSMLDASWAGARYLEVEPMGDGSAAGDSILLQARRHQRLVQKSHGAESSWTGGRGKGKGFRNPSWQSWYGEGEGGKPQKGKEKGKKGGKKGKATRGDQASKQDWKDSLEKPGENKNS